MQFPQTPAIGDEVTNDLTGAVYCWDGLMWHNVPVEVGRSIDPDDLGKLFADQTRQDVAIAEEKRDRMDADDCLQAGIGELGDALQDLHNYDDGPIKEQITQLQEGFDAAVIAAQEGAENLTLELQSYSKKTHNHDNTYSAKDHSHDYLPLSGGELTNTLTGKLIKSIRNTGYAFEAKPDNVTTTVSIHTDGSAKFKGSVKVDGTELAKVDHTHSNYAASDHNHGSTYAPYSHVHSSYASSSHTHSGYASSSHSHSEMAILRTGSSTNPTLSQGEMYLNTTQKVLYIGV